RIYKESHQIIDLVSMFKPVTKWAELIPRPEAVPEMVRKAFKLAQTERPGAVYLALPEDVEKMPVPPGHHPLEINVVRDTSPSPAQISRAAKVLGTAKRQSEEHTSELQSRFDLVCRLLLEKKKEWRR